MAFKPPAATLKYGLMIGLVLSVAVVAYGLWWSVSQAPMVDAKRVARAPKTMASLQPLVPDVPDMPDMPDRSDAPEMSATPKPEIATVLDKAIEQDTPHQNTAVADPLAAINASPVLSTSPPDMGQLTSGIVAASNQSWQANLAQNGASFDAADTKPRLALMVADLGLAASVTDAAMATLPPQISLSFWANAPQVAQNMAAARARGFEVFLAVPMEPLNFPQNDAGPNSLLTNLNDPENMARLNAHLSKAQNYVGVVPAMGGQFVTARDKLAPVMRALQQQGLMVVDTTQAPQSFITSLARTQNMPFVKIDRVIDAALGEDAWQAQLNGLVQLAKTNGRAAGVIMPYPAAFKQLAPFLADLPNKGIALAPMSALVK
jgi:uncharacterized protein